MWPRSASRPSETSIAAEATPTSAWPRATRGRGLSSAPRHSRGHGSGSAMRPCRCASPRAASPGRPDTQTRSPARAPSRRSACPGAHSPSAVRQRLSGPRVVSPPTMSTPYSAAQANRPSANFAIHASSTAGSAPASSAQRGVAPIAARSDRFTANVFQPRFQASVPGRKWVPATSMSVVTASCLPGEGCSRAQSSPGPSVADGVARVK